MSSWKVAILAGFAIAGGGGACFLLLCWLWGVDALAAFDVDETDVDLSWLVDATVVDVRCDDDDVDVVVLVLVAVALLFR